VYWNLANSITLSSSRPGSRAGSRAGLQPVLAKFHYAIQVVDLVADPRRQVRAISTCRDSSNLVADRFRPYSTTLSCSLAGRRPVRDQIPLRCRACDQLASWSQAGQHNGIWPATRTRRADAGLRPAASRSQTSSRAGRRPARELVTSWIV